jgi:hypothetical protein
MFKIKVTIMTRKLQFLLTAILLMVGVTSAWGEDYDGTSPVYDYTNSKNYANLKAAVADFTAGTSESPVTRTLYIYKDVTLGTADNSSIAVPKYATLNIVPQAKDLKLTRGTHKRGNRWFLVNDNSQTLNIGSDTYKLTFEDDGSTVICNTILRREAGTMNINNVTFKNIKFGNGGTNEYGYLYSTNVATLGKCILKDITVSNCTTTTTEAPAFFSSKATNNDAICLKGAINFTSCTGTHFYIAARIRLGDPDGGSATSITASATPITIYWANTTTSINTPVVVKATSSMASIFSLTNPTLGLKHDNVDLKIAWEYTLKIGAAGAATLVLPFESTIPSSPTDLTCYNLAYTSGDNITATAVSTATLPANSAVLVTGTANTDYKFVYSGSGGAATGSGQTEANGVLIGNYDTDYVIPATTGDNTNYILSYKNSQLGFRKVDGSTNKVQPNRAYMSVKYVAGSGSARDFFGINFGGETTGIDNLNVNVNANDNFDANAPMYNLAGQRVGANYKGVVIQNGKKYIKK